jgi:ketosteroid isomerase-like protein
MRLSRSGLCALVGALTLSACAHGTIPGTEIEDTDANRGILKLVEEYKQAVERMDADAVMALVSPTYYEDNGNVDTSDDYDFKGLEAQLRSNFGRTKAIQLILRVDDVQVEEDEAFAELYYQLRAHAQYPSGPKWETQSDRTRLRFQKVDDRWLIVAGL